MGGEAKTRKGNKECHVTGCRKHGKEPSRSHKRRETCLVAERLAASHKGLRPTGSATTPPPAHTHTQSAHSCGHFNGAARRQTDAIRFCSVHCALTETRDVVRHPGAKERFRPTKPVFKQLPDALETASCKYAPSGFALSASNSPQTLRPPLKSDNTNGRLT